MTITLDSISGMPAISSYYPPPPARYRSTVFQYVYFRADIVAIGRVLPACFDPSDDGFCAAVGLRTHRVPRSALCGDGLHGGAC